MQGLCEHKSICFSHFEPSKPTSHVHSKPLTKSLQVPLFKHGLLLHSFISTEHVNPVYP
jgi:hypothetical protein